jgi:hypothetical protein
VVSFLKFDLEPIPDGATIEMATLRLNCHASWGAQPPPEVTIGARAVSDTSSWNEGEITWNNAPDYSANLTDTATGISGWFDWLVTDDVIAALSGRRGSDYSVALTYEEGPGSSGRLFYSKEEPQHLDKHPYLEIVYTPPAAVSQITWGAIKALYVQ